ncbi:MAG: VOC family protein [Deltaproteobacteria bacterium]|nr:VOC family protein [Deltaproteobacteria bacterium]
MITSLPRVAIAVRDFDAAVSFFRDTLGVTLLGARLAMCVPDGGSNIEIMSPAIPDAPLAKSLQKQFEHRGEGLFAMMLEAPDPNAAAEELSSRGLKVLPPMRGSWGRDVHPASTHGVLIRVYPNDSFTGTPPEPPGCLGLSGIQRTTVIVRDLDAAIARYGDGLGLETSVPIEDADRGLRIAIARAPKGGVVELATVTNPNAVEALAPNKVQSEGMVALTLDRRHRERTAETWPVRGTQRRCAIARPRPNVWHTFPDCLKRVRRGAANTGSEP